MKRASVALWAVGLSGCASMMAAPVPMTSLVQRDAHGPAKCLVVFLPGVGDHADRFAREGLVEALTKRNLSVDVVSAEATLGYYAQQTVTERLETDVIGPARAAGYAETWLVGVSLGGGGSLSYAMHRPGQVTGVLALSPWLGSDDIVREVRSAGGLAAWHPTASDDFERQLWTWLRNVTVDGAAGPELYVGWGDADRLAAADSLLGSVLPAERVFHSRGGHGWQTWRELFSQFLDRSSFAKRCAAPPAIDPVVQARVCNQFTAEDFHEAPAALPAPRADDELVLTRGPCLGRCVAYQLTIKGDGRVFLVVTDGPLVGLEDYRVDATTVRRLFNEFAQTGFDTRPFVETREASTCGQKVSLTHVAGGKATRVEQQNVVLVPEDQARLTHLQRLVDTVADTGHHLARCPPVHP